MARNDHRCRGRRIAGRYRACARRLGELEMKLLRHWLIAVALVAALSLVYTLVDFYEWQTNQTEK